MRKLFEISKKIKEDIATASLAAIDENLPFIVECDASDVIVSAALNQVADPSLSCHAHFTRPNVITRP